MHAAASHWPRCVDARAHANDAKACIEHLEGGHDTGLQHRIDCTSFQDSTTFPRKSTGPAEDLFPLSPYSLPATLTTVQNSADQYMINNRNSRDTENNLRYGSCIPPHSKTIHSSSESQTHVAQGQYVINSRNSRDTGNYPKYKSRIPLDFGYSQCTECTPMNSAKRNS